MQAAQIEISDSFWGELEPLVKHFEVGVDR
jgi:hypothetical protein